MLIAVLASDSGGAAILMAWLADAGYAVEHLPTLEAAAHSFARRDVDALIVDGVTSGCCVEFITNVRAQRMWAPIVVLMQADSVSEYVRLLEAGADDCIRKPVTPSELLARLRAVSRRASAPRWAPLGFAGVKLDSEERRAIIGDRLVHLSPREYALLELLMRRRNHLVSREEILPSVFGYGFNPGTNIVDVHVAHLRRKLERSELTIETVRGQGFRLRAR